VTTAAAVGVAFSTEMVIRYQLMQWGLVHTGHVLERLQLVALALGLLLDEPDWRIHERLLGSHIEARHKP